MTFSHDEKLNEIATSATNGERLSFADGVALYATNDLPALGKLADLERRRHGRTTFFNVNRHLNPTNICYADCKFCGFFRTPRQPDAYTHNIDDSLKVAGQAGRRRRDRIAHHGRIKYETSVQLLYRSAVVSEARLSAVAPEGVYDGRV